MACSTEIHVWPSGAGEPEGQSRAGGLLRVSNRVPYFHTSRGLCGDTMCNTEYATGGKGVMEVTTRLLSFMHSHAWFGMENETTKCTSTPSAKQLILGEMQCKCLHAGCLSGPPAPTGCWVV